MDDSEGEDGGGADSGVASKKLNKRGVKKVLTPAVDHDASQSMSFTYFPDEKSSVGRRENTHATGKEQRTGPDDVSVILLSFTSSAVAVYSNVLLSFGCMSILLL